MRSPLIVANWKMNLGPEPGLELYRELRRRLGRVDAVELVVCPPFVTLPVLATARPPSGRGALALGAQDCHWEAAGAHTGDISPAMLRPLCEWVIVGHSERRAAHGESDAIVHRKLHAARRAGLRPILCIGESSDDRAAGRTAEVLRRQLEIGFGDLEPEGLARDVVVAYEPVWAIGSGEPASPAEANRVAGLIIRGVLSERAGEPVAASLRVLYGGSVDAGNIAAFLRQPEIDGALVGGASLDADRFTALVTAAAAESRRAAG